MRTILLLLLFTGISSKNVTNDVEAYVLRENVRARDNANPSANHVAATDPEASLSTRADFPILKLTPGKFNNHN